MPKKNAFTLIELLVVIAIVALLISILIPALQVAKEQATGAVCLANLSGMCKSYILYAEENDAWIVEGACVTRGATAYGHTWENPWVEVPKDANGNPTGHNSTIEEKINGIQDGALFPYAESAKVYHCPGDKRQITNVEGGGKGGYRTYSIPTGLFGEWVGGYTVDGKDLQVIKKYNEVRSPGDKFVYIEEFYTHIDRSTSDPRGPNRGYNAGAWMIWNGGQSTSWWDPLALTHNERGTLGYLDGHAEKWNWQDQRTIDFAEDRYTTDYNQPGNPDQEKITQAMAIRGF